MPATIEKVSSLEVNSGREECQGSESIRSSCSESTRETRLGFFLLVRVLD